MDEQQQRRMNEAAERYAEVLPESYRAATDRTGSVRELNAQLPQQFFNTVMDNLRTQTENLQAASGGLAEQIERGQKAAQALMQESVATYVLFPNTMFPATGADERSVNGS
jgi:hypothetical protein